MWALLLSFDNPPFRIVVGHELKHTAAVREPVIIAYGKEIAVIDAERDHGGNQTACIGI